MSVVVDDRVWRELQRKLKGLAKAHVRVGVLSSKGGNASHGSAGSISMLELFAIHELGSPAAGIPARAPIRKTFIDKKQEAERITAKLAKKLLANQITHKSALETLGLWGVAQVKNTVQKGAHLTPALKPATVASKGSTRPLIDTGRMINAVQHEVKL